MRREQPEVARTGAKAAVGGSAEGRWGAGSRRPSGSLSASKAVVKKSVWASPSAWPSAAVEKWRGASGR
ncbi:MAG: hypothetical protein M3322_09345, partial [Actinomycetota bacterium]|nr:hypothetical protein [Actinomycetota bacterium]